MDPQNYYFQYTINPDADEPIMFIDKHIGFDEDDGYGIMGDAFQKELLMLDGMEKKRIQVWINSLGGIVMDGYNIYNAILKSKTKVDTYCFGMAASIAAVIFQAGRNRIMCDYGILMYHNPFGGDDDSVKAMRDSITKMIATRSGMTEDEVAKIMARKTFLDADEALALKLCDKIEVSGDYNKKRLPAAKASSTEQKYYWREAGLIANKLIETKIVRKMKKVANKLNLNEDATEDSIMAEIAKIENKAAKSEKDCTDKEKELADKKDELKKKGDEYDKLKGEHDQIKAELDKMKKDTKDKEEADKTKAESEETDKAKAKVMNLVKIGKIKNEAKAIEKWTKIAKENPDDLDDLVGAQPLNKVANKIELPIGGSGDGIPKSVIAATMIKNSAKILGEKASA